MGIDNLELRQAVPESLPKGWWLMLAIYLPGIVWLSLRTRVFIDQVWTTEYGRRLLQPDTTYSMYMLTDGQTLPPHSWLGSLLAELAMSSSNGLLGFRLLAAAAAVILAYSMLRLLQRQGVTAGLALLAAAAFLFDASVTQSVVVGRADTLALALLFGGVNLAAWAASSQATTTRSLNWMALGYALCALAPAMWGTSLLLGPIAALSWALNIHRVLGQQPAIPRVSVYLRLLLLPALVFLVAVVLPFAVWTDDSTEAGISWLMQIGGGFWGFLDYSLQQVSVSVCLVLAGTFALTQIKPRWLAAILLLGCAGVIASGFYPFRVPYLLAYMMVAIAVHAGKPQGEVVAQAWSRLLMLSLVVAIGLFGVRILFSFTNETHPQTKPWFSNYPTSVAIADFSWDFYEAGRAQQRRLMRSFPGDAPQAVSHWLQQMRPDFVVHASDTRGSWVMVDDLTTMLSNAQYCKVADVHWDGTPVDSSVRVRPAPSPLLWRMGMFRNYGPYALWARCVDGQSVPEALPSSPDRGHP